MPRLAPAFPILLPAWLLLAAAAAADSGLPVPRFVSLASDEVNLRAGPGRQYPVDWVFVREALPLEVVGEFDVWRRVRDRDGVEGWVHRSLLSGRRNVVVEGPGGGGEAGEAARLPLHAEPDPDAPVVALIEPGVIARLLTCPAADEAGAGWCEVEAAGTPGWLPRDALWGVYPGEAVER
jgi:SH3-like domain-containing protein